LAGCHAYYVDKVAYKIFCFVSAISLADKNYDASGYYVSSFDDLVVGGLMVKQCLEG